MGAFELNNREIVKDTSVNRDDNSVLGAETASRPDSRRIKDECIIALKVYDSCRHPCC